MCDSWNTDYIFSFAATHSVLTYGSNFHLRIASMAVNFLVSLSDPLFAVSQHPPIIYKPVLRAKTQAPHEPASTLPQWNNEEMDICLLLH